MPEITLSAPITATSQQALSEATKVEPKVPEAAPEAPKPGAEDARLAQLARREKALRAEKRQMQSIKEELAALKSQLGQKPVDERSIREQLKQDFLKDPTSFGLTYEDIGNRYLKQPSPEEQQMAALKAEIEALKGESKKALDQVAEQQTKAYQDAVKQISREVNLLVDSNAAFETVKAAEAQSAVVAHIEAVYKEEGIVLSAEEAAQEVEEVLLEQAVSFAKLQKVQSRLAPAPQKTEAAQAGSQAPKTPTLSRDAMSASSKPLTAAERRARAIAVLQGKQI